jgi:hypothetical protein
MENMRTSTSWTDREWDIFKDFILDTLKTNIATITFTKKDGVERVMTCTLNPDLLPKIPVNENKKERVMPVNSIAVYDTGIKDWRSFVVKSVKLVELTINP